MCPEQLDVTSPAYQDSFGQNPQFMRIGRYVLWGVVGVPSNSIGANNDFALRFDGAAGANTTLYHKEAGIWQPCTL